MENKFQRYLLAPLAVLCLVGAVDLIRLFEWYSVSLALPFAGLAIGIWYGGLRANLAAAAILSTYAFMTYDPLRFIQVAAAAFLIAAPSGLLKRSLRAATLEAEYYRLKAIDSYNGNRAKMVEALDSLDGALEILRKLQGNSVIKPVFELVQAARIKQADTLTLTSSWHEMAQDRRIVIEEMEKASGYPWRADDQIRETNLLVREVLRRLEKKGGGE
jgi:hypothetical protein